MKKKVKIKPLKTSFEVCLEMKFNQNTRDYVIFKYREENLNIDDWKVLFKKDGLNF